MLRSIVNTFLLAETHVVEDIGVLPKKGSSGCATTRQSSKIVKSLCRSQALFRHPAEELARVEVQAGFP